jgi:hypothetical protein
MTTFSDSESVPNGSGLGVSGEPIEAKDTLIVAILTQLTECQRLLDAGPASRLGLCIEQVAGTIGHCVATLAGDLPVANPSPAVMEIPRIKKRAKAGHKSFFKQTS